LSSQSRAEAMLRASKEQVFSRRVGILLAPMLFRQAGRAAQRFDVNDDPRG